jgi:4-hydroxybenzoate polyprenyltransferase
MWIVGTKLDLGQSYYAGLLGAVGFAVYQQILLRHRDRNDCLRAFQNNHLLGSVIFLGLVLEYWQGL